MKAMVTVAGVGRDELLSLPAVSVDLVQDPGDVVAVVTIDPAALATVPGARHAWLVEPRLQWDGFPDRAPVVPGVKQVSFLHRAAAMDRAAFARHWTENHAPLARAHHPALWRYRQNVVVDTLLPGTPDIDGIAELGMRLRLDFRERMYDSDEGRRTIAEDVRRFLDLRRSWQLITREHHPQTI